MRVSSDDIEGRDKVPVLREFYGRELMRVDLIAQNNGAPVFFDATVANVGWAKWAACHSSAFESVRTAQLLTDGCDDIYLATADAGIHFESSSEAFYVKPGGAFLIPKARAYRYVNDGASASSCILVPRERLAAMLPQLGEAPLMLFEPGTPGLDLFFGYARLAATSSTSTPDMQAKAAGHLLELMASIVDPQREKYGRADPDNIANARIEAIKQNIRSHLTDPDLSLQRVAARHGMTPRHMQRLFEREGDSFSDFLRKERLARAWDTLTNPRHARRSILSIAFESGFNEITTFNRAFRRTYGITPSEARERNGADDS